MVRASSEQSPEMTLGTRESEMSPRVREHAHKVHAELLDLYRDFGVTNMKALTERIAAAPQDFANPGHHANLLRIHVLAETLQSILMNPKEYILPLEREFREKETELRELFQEGFLGFHEVELAFRLKSGEAALTVSEEEREWAMQDLVEKLAESDVVKFLHRLEEQPEEAKDWVLVYRTQAEVRGSPVSLNSMIGVLDKDSREGVNPEPLVSEIHRVSSWFVTAEKRGTLPSFMNAPLAPGWMFVTREIVPGSKGAGGGQGPGMSAKREVLRKFGAKKGFDGDKCHFRTPQETMYDLAVMYRSRGKRMLRSYDCSATKLSGRYVLAVGMFAGGGGIRLYDHEEAGGDGTDGATLSR